MDYQSLKKKFHPWSLESKGLYYRLSIIFSLFFLVPVLSFLYFSIKYDILQDEGTPFIFIALLVSSLLGYIMVRKIFDEILSASKNISDTLAKDIVGFSDSIDTNELKGILHSFRTLESELRNSILNLDNKVSQISILKELSELCYMTFDLNDLFYITLERALKLVNADVGSVMILERPHRETFIVHANIGLGEILKKGDRVDFATSIAKFAVINKSPLLVEDIEKDMRFGRSNRLNYGTKAFLIMPLKALNEVLGVVTLSRRSTNVPFTTEDVDVLIPLLSNAAFTYDNLSLMEKNKIKAQHIKRTENIFNIIGSSLAGGELLHALLTEIREGIAFDTAIIMMKDETIPDSVAIVDCLSSIPMNIDKGSRYHYEGSVVGSIVKHERSLLINDTSTLTHPLERALFVNNQIQSCLLAPLKVRGDIVGILALGTLSAGTLEGTQSRVETMTGLLSLAMEKDRLSASVMKRDREKEFIRQIGSVLASSTFDVKEVLRHTMNMIQGIMNVEAGSLWLLVKDEITVKASFNINVEPLREFRLKLGQGIPGHSAASGASLIVRDAPASPHFNPEFDRRTGFKTKAALCVPLISQGKILGIIEILNKVNGEFNDSDLHLLQSIATSVSIALENSRLYQETLSMAAHERGIRKVFQKFVPKEIVDRITDDTHLEKHTIDELKILTLLNIDIRGFSTLSKRIPPQRIVSMLNHFFASMGEIVFKHQGIVDKYLGDGFLALFGAPISGISDADNAIAAALEMKNNMAAINEYIREEIAVPLIMGISIHTGEAVVGNIGFEKKMDYTVIGDSVNVVFNLQDLTKSSPNIILISEKTKQAATKSILEVREIGTYDAGQILGALKIYELLGQQRRP